MIRHHALWSGCLIAVALTLAGWTALRAAAQSPDPQSPPKISAEQHSQLDQLKQLEERLQKDREAMREATTQYGWDSDQADAAQEQLARDRMEYRKLRRSLRSAGVPVPPPAGMEAGPGGSRPAGMAGRAHHRGHGGHHCPDCDCPCCAE